MYNSPPPKDEETEHATLGSIIIDGSQINLIAEILQPGDFYKTANKKIYTSMLDMYRESKPIDILTLTEYLRSQNTLDEVGGFNYLDYLREMTPTSVNSIYYAELVKKSSELREIHEFTAKLSLDIQSNKIDAIQAKAKLEEFTNSIEADKSLEFVELYKEPPPRVREWILENLIPKGFPTTLYASGGVGKSYLALFWAINACIGDCCFLDKEFYKKPLNTLYLDYELDRDEINRRVIEVCNGLGLEGIPENFFYHSPGLKISKFLNQLPKYIKLKNIELLVIDSMGAGNLDAMDERSVISVYSRLRDLGITTLLVDHPPKLQLQDNEENKTPYGSTYKSNMSRSVIHLLQEGKRKNPLTVKLVHKKTNFGELCDDYLIDFIFDKENNSVFISESSSISRKEEDLLMIKHAIEKITSKKEVIQKDLIDYFKNTFARDKLRSLLLDGEGKHWAITNGKINNARIYVPINGV